MPLAATVTLWPSAYLNVGVLEETRQTEPLPLYRVENVTHYTYNKDSSVVLETATTATTANPVYIFVIDTLFDDAFGHWVYESAIYLPLYLRLKRLYFPHLKLHVKTPRRYKRLFYDYFGIHDLIFDFQQHPNNVCLVPLPVSAWNRQEISDTYKYYVDALFEIFAKRILEVPKTKFVVCSPRGKQENYPGNDRRIDVTELEKELPRKYSDASVSFLHTDQIESLGDQIEAVAGAQNLILMDGSAYYVNGLFASGSQILVVGGCCVLQHNQEFPKMAYVHQKILHTNNNTIHFPCSTHYVPFSAVQGLLQT